MRLSVVRLVEKLFRNQSRWIFLFPLAIFLALRLPLLHFPLFGDEDILVRDAAMLGRSSLSGYPILSLIFLRLGLLFLGLKNLRWITFLFSLGVFSLTLAIAEMLIGFNGALWASLLLALNPLSVSVSCQLLFDGAFVCFFLLSIIYFYLRHLRREEKGVRDIWNLILCGIAFGLLQMTSYAAFAFIPGLALYSWMKRGLKKTISTLGVIAVLGALIFSIYPILNPAHYQISTHKLGFLHSGIRILKLFAMPWLYASSLSKALIFAGPLPILGVFGTFLDVKRRERVGLPLAISLTYIALLLIFINPDRTIGYWSPVIPLLCIIAAQEITALTMRRWTHFSITVGLYCIVLAALTLSGLQVITPVHPMRWSWRVLLYFFPIRMFYGPSLCLYLRPAAVFFAFGACFLLMFWKRKSPILHRHFIALGLAYGAFYSLEYVHPEFSPNLNLVGTELIASLERTPAPKPIYLHGYGALDCEMHGIEVYSFMYNSALIHKLILIMDKTKGSVVIANSPAIGPQSQLMRFLRKDAVLARSFSDDGVVLARIWTLK